MHKANDSGLTLIETLVALAVFSAIISVVAVTFTTQRKSYGIQQQITEMTQTARSAMDMMTREIRMAGYDPSGSGFSGLSLSSNAIQVLSDLNGDGDTADENEDIAYSYDAANLEINRVSGGASVLLADSIQGFSFTCYKADGSETTDAGSVRKIRIEMTARTSKPDPNYTDNNGYRTYGLVSTVTPKNLGF